MPYIIAIDIGGTNCRFGLFAISDKSYDSYDSSNMTLENLVWKKTADFHNVDDLLTACEEIFGDLNNIDAFVIALAGPVSDPKYASMTNADLVIDLSQKNNKIYEKIHLINDFGAQAYSCLTDVVKQSQVVWPVPEKAKTKNKKSSKDTSNEVYQVSKSPIAILGAGTGFGCASLVRGFDNKWLAIPSEAGHIPFPLRNVQEIQLDVLMCIEYNLECLTANNLLSGSGLVRISKILEMKDANPEEILNEDCETRRWFYKFYGRICRVWMLTTLCYGGLFIAGGIAAKHPDIFTSEEFQKELCGDNFASDFINNTPIRLITDENSGLWGATYFGLNFI